MAPGTQNQLWQEWGSQGRAGQEQSGSSRREAGGVCLGGNMLSTAVDLRVRSKTPHGSIGYFDSNGESQISHLSRVASQGV